MSKQLGRMAVTTALSVGASMLAASALAGPVGMVVGAIACIGIALADFFLGPAFWDTLLGKESFEEHYMKTLDAAYELFDLPRSASNETLRAAYRSAVVRYSTVRASNFGPHVNFGFFFSEGLAIIKSRPTEK
jgi:hypothetical protein